jgi:hypothetical protein
MAQVTNLYHFFNLRGTEMPSCKQRRHAAIVFESFEEFLELLNPRKIPFLLMLPSGNLT